VIRSLRLARDDPGEAGPIRAELVVYGRAVDESVAVVAVQTPAVGDFRNGLPERPSRSIVAILGRSGNRNLAPGDGQVGSCVCKWGAPVDWNCPKTCITGLGIVANQPEVVEDGAACRPKVVRPADPGELAAGVVGFPADPRIRRAACLAAAGQIVAEADQKWIVASLGCRLEVALALHRGRHIRVGVLVRGVADLDGVRILAIQIDEVPTVDIPGPAAELGYAVRGVLGLLVSVVGGRGGRRGFGRRGQVVLTNARGEK